MIAAGTIISCPGCGLPLLKCLVAPVNGQANYHECFENIEWPGKVGDQCVCHACDAPFFRLGQGLWVKGHGFTW